MIKRGLTTIAFSALGAVVVVASMLVRRANLRRLIYALAVLVALLVGADRVLLGRHYPTDVLGGYLVGVGMTLLWLGLYSPLPRSHAEFAVPLTC